MGNFKYIVYFTKQKCLNHKFQLIFSVFLNMFLDNKIFIQFLLLNSNFTQCLLDNRICTHFLKRSTAFSHFVLEQHFYNVMKQSISCYLCALFVIIKLNLQSKIEKNRRNFSNPACPHLLGQRRRVSELSYPVVGRRSLSKLAWE